jgi:hypothetical protein
VGNFGNGRINAFDATTGEFLAQLKDPDGEPIQIDGLWALRVGNKGAGGATNTVYFTAGLFGETHGLFGALTTAAPGSPEGMAEAQFVTANVDVVQLDLATVLQDLSTGVPAATFLQDLRALRAALVALIQVETDFGRDEHGDLSQFRAADQAIAEPLEQNGLFLHLAEKLEDF